MSIKTSQFKAAISRLNYQLAKQQKHIHSNTLFPSLHSEKLKSQVTKVLSNRSLNRLLLALLLKTMICEMVIHKKTTHIK